ncbi:MAG TPA: YbaB/EbfC family nucleoid-associated protein [Armatimonadetes bacterium]|nr:YbaB/EbfC family nucleoid-associated protein [Armatimonadota bacterium]
MLKRMLEPQLREMQEQMRKVEEELEGEVLEASAGGGAVKVRISASGDFKEVRIDPSVVNPEDVGMLQDLVLAAVREAQRMAEERRRERMGELAQRQLKELGNFLGLGPKGGAG